MKIDIFYPRHTLIDVAKQIEAGLCDGSIVLTNTTQHIKQKYHMTERAILGIVDVATCAFLFFIAKCTDLLTEQIVDVDHSIVYVHTLSKIMSGFALMVFIGAPLLVHINFEKYIGRIRGRKRHDY